MPHSEQRVCFAIPNSRQEIQPGDILLTRNEDQFTNDTPGYWNHVGVMSFWGYVVEAQALPRKVIAVPVSAFWRRYPAVLVRRPALQQIEQEALATHAGSLVGLAYLRMASVILPRLWQTGHNCVSVARASFFAASGIDPCWRTPDTVAESSALRSIAGKLHFAEHTPQTDPFAEALYQFPP